MAALPEREDRRDARSVLLLGAGRRAKETGAVLAALAALADEGGAPVPMGVGDLEELLAQRPREGLLILESGRVPAEDIGFVRRFLERHPGWRLILLSEDAQEARARALLALPRAQWLAWPPDLEQLRALLPAPAVVPPPAAEPPASTGRAPEGGSTGAARRPVRRVASERAASPVTGPSPAAGGVDLGDLVEELLASAALQGEGAPRYQYRCPESVFVQRERTTLVEGLTGLVELARRCAGPDGLVRAVVDTTRAPAAGDPTASGVRIGLDFPRSRLDEKDLAGLFERPFPAEGDAQLAVGVAAAQHSASVLREAGGEVELVPEPPGRVRCEVRLALRPPAPPPAALPPTGDGRRRPGKPEDPFA